MKQLSYWQGAQVARASTKALLAALVALFVAGCSTVSPGVPQGTSDMPRDDMQPSWTAYGFLSPGTKSDPQLIGMYATKSECDAALGDWLASQVVGNPIDGECLPIDRQ